VKQLAATAGGASKSVEHKVAWKAAKAAKRGFVDLNRACGQQEWCVAYGYTEITSIHAREAVLSCGSDDGIRVWLNGQVVHSNDAGRGYTPDSDTATVQLKAGVNHLLVKVSQHTGGWGFGVGISEPNF
jgi:hypothetical protein